MKTSTLASKLIETRSRSQRRKLLTENRRLAGVRLARLLKDRCYRMWTATPAEARYAAAALNELAKFCGDDEIEAIRLWIEGIADITRSRLESAIENLDAASKLLAGLGHEHESAQPQVAKLMALAMLGRYDEAATAGEKALRIFERYGDQLAAGKIEMNLSNVVSRRDQYRAAESYCLSAYRRFKRLGEKGWQTMAENGLANTYAELNDFKRAERFYADALRTARSARMNLTVAEIEASLGNLALFRGRYADALRWLELSRRKYEALEMPHQTAIADLEIADIYAELNLGIEAVEMYRRLLPTLRRLKLRAEEARARSNLGRVLIASGHVREARAELRRAAGLYRVEKNSVAAAAVDLRQASLELPLRRFTTALTLVENAAAALADKGNIRLELSAIWLRGEIHAQQGQLEEAERCLTEAKRRSRKHEQPAIEQASMNSLGLLAGRRGKLKLAIKLFEGAISVSESARAPLPGEEFRMAFFAKTLEPYENLTRLYLSNGDPSRAFATVERARARSLLENVVGSVDRADGASVKKLREELNWYYSRTDRADSEDLPKLQIEIRKREQQLAEARRRIESTRGRTRNRKIGVDLNSISAKLGPNRTLVEFVLHDGVFSAFIVTAREVDHFPDLATEAEIRALLEGLHFQFGSLRFAGQAMAPFMAQLKERADSYLARLYEKLIAPFRSHLGDGELIIVPAGALHYVPFNAVFDGERYLVQSHTVAYSPSAAVWERLNTRRTRKPEDALLMAYADERIPLVDDEVKRLSAVLRNPKVLKGRQATFAAFEENAPRFDVIHLACHGHFRPDNPMFSSLHLADGWVTVQDATTKRLRAQLVTLSACETGLSKIAAGEEILGLARGFLSAGARSLLLTLWTVNDEATAGLMENFYRNWQRGHNIAASLADAQRNLIKNGEHPYFWSPFFVIG